MKKQIMPGSIVELDLSIRLLDGTEIFTTLNDDERYQITLGQNDLPQGLELSLYGLTEGEEQTMTLSPDQAWGDYDPELQQRLPRQDFAMEIEPGTVLSFDLPDGQSFPGLVKAVDEKEVLVDFNHPLAGQSIVFWSRIIRIENPS